MALRNRQRGGFAPILSSSIWWATGYRGFAGTPTTGVYPDRVGSRETMSDVVTPAYRKLQAEGRIVNNPMSKTEVITSGGDSGWKFTARVIEGSNVTDYFGECTGNWCLATYGPPAQPTSDASLVQLLTDLASTKAWAGIEAPAVQGQVILAELKKTISMLVNPLAGLTGFIKDRRKWEKYRGRKPRGSTRNQQARNRTARESLVDGAASAAASWNEARFGWRPFLMDIEAILKLLQQGDFGDRKVSRVKQERVVESTRTYTGHSEGVDIDFSEQTTSYYTVRTGFLYQYQNSPLRDFGFSWADLPSSAWELIPFSFVVDWFVNVGDYIQAITPKYGTTILAAWTKLEITHEVERHAVAARLPVAGWVTQRHPNGVDRGFYLTKSRSPSVAPPTLAVELDIVHALRNNRGWDALGLFTSNFLGAKSARRKLY